MTSVFHRIAQLDNWCTPYLSIVTAAKVNDSHLSQSLSRVSVLWPIGRKPAAKIQMVGTLYPTKLWMVFAIAVTSLIARFMGPTRGPSGADRTQVGPMLAPWTLLSAIISYHIISYHIKLLSQRSRWQRSCCTWTLSHSPLKRMGTIKMIYIYIYTYIYLVFMTAHFFTISVNFSLPGFSSKYNLS